MIVLHHMIVATVANSWFTQDPANVTRFGSSYAGHKLLTKSIKKGFDTILKGIPQHTNNRVRAWFILFTFEFLFRWIRNLPLFFFVFFWRRMSIYVTDFLQKNMTCLMINCIYNHISKFKKNKK